jgi:hypothetical protein
MTDSPWASYAWAVVAALVLDHAAAAAARRPERGAAALPTAAACPAVEAGGARPRGVLAVGEALRRGSVGAHHSRLISVLAALNRAFENFKI